MRDRYKDNASTYFVMDRSNRDEMKRVHIQDQMITASMGGVLPEQPDPTRFQSVLDVGCGTGGWLIEAARTYPTMTRLVGIDISERMIAYAQEQAKAQGVSDRMQFYVKDALRSRDFPPEDVELTFSFPDQSFDLVNQRLGLSWLRQWDWKDVLWEYQRVCKIGGVIRLTECNMVTESSSPGYLYLWQLLVQAFYRAGNFFTPTPDGVTNQLAHLLHQYAVIYERNIQTQAYALEYRAGTPEGQAFYEDVRLGTRTLKPFITRWVLLSDHQESKQFLNSGGYDKLYQRILKEMQQPDCVTTWRFLTAWGVKTKHYT
jgi:ubiquinone/menaquinone biosynthesis C-methylase UbiE